MRTLHVELDRLSAGTGPAAYRDRGCPESLLASLREQGQTQPLLVAERPSTFVLASGHRRCQGLLSLGQERVTVSVVPAPRDLDVLRVSVLENSTSAGFNDLERARIVRHLLDTYSLDANTVATEWMPWLGLDPSIQLLRTYAFFGREDVLHDGLRTGAITIGLGRALIRFDPSELPLAARLLNRGGLSFSQKKELLYLLDELQRRDSVPLAELAGGKQGEPLLEESRAKRYPQAMDRNDQLKQIAGKHPGWLTMRENKTEGLEVRFVFRGIEELRERVRELLRISKDRETARVIEKF